VIEQRLHGPEAFNLDLDAPPSVIQRLTLDPDHPQTVGYGTVVITDVWVDPAAIGSADTGTSFHPLMDMARWSGILARVAPDGQAISGHGLAFRLGSPDNTGELMVGNAMTSASEQNARIFTEDADTWLDVLVNGNIGAPITSPDGSSATLELRSSHLYDATFHGTPTASVPYFPEALTRADVLTRIGSFTGTFWYVDAQGVAHMGTRTDLFPDGPRCIVGNVEPDPDWMTLLADLDLDWDLAGWANKWVAFNGKKNTAYPWDTIYAFPNNVDLINEYYRDLLGEPIHQVGIEASNQNETVGQWQDRMEAARSERETPRRQFTISGAPDEHSHRLIPGEPIYVYHPDAGVQDTANEVYCGGQVIHPAVVTLHGMSWPFRQGMGAFVLYHDDDTDSIAALDLTPYVVPEDNRETTLEVGSLRYTL
jgi:hypothetical protein